MTNQELEKLIEGKETLFRARSSDVFDIGDEKVLKLYHEDVDDESLKIEYDNTCTAYEKGCTPMECFGMLKVNGRNGLVFKKLYGISLTDAPTKISPAYLFKGGPIIAEQHAMVHSQITPNLRDVREVAVNTINKGVEAFSFLSDEERTKAIDYINSLPAADNMIHLDFHTDNIMVNKETGAIQTIDWMTACKGDPRCEVAMMNWLFHDAELFPGCSKLELFLYGTIRVFIFNKYMKAYTKLTGIEKAESKPWDLVAWVLRYGIWQIESERELLQKYMKEFIENI